MVPDTVLKLGDVMDLICDHKASAEPAFYADVAVGAAQAGMLLDILRAQVCSWPYELLERLIVVIESQSSEPATLAVQMDEFPIPVTLPRMSPLMSDIRSAAEAFRLGRLLFLAFLAQRSASWGIDLSGDDPIDRIADKVSDAIGMIARVRNVSMGTVESLLHLEAV